MSVIMEEDERTSHGSQGPSVGEDGTVIITSPTSSARNSFREDHSELPCDSLDLKPNFVHADEMNHEERAYLRTHSEQTSSLEQSNGELEDGVSQEYSRGGGGDTGGDMGKEEEKILSANTLEKERSSFMEEIQSKSGSIGAVTEVSYSKESRESELQGEREGFMVSGNSESVKSEEPESKSSAESMNTGFQIATQIVEDLIDTVMKITEREESIKGSQRDKNLKQSSIMTIKSEDEQGSLAVDPELQAQMAVEEEAAAFRRQKIYQQNIAQYHTLLASRVNLKRKNVYLLKQMYEHFKRKKIEHLFREIPVANADMESKYVQTLLAFQEAQKAAIDEELKMSEQSYLLEEKRKGIESELEKEWNSLINREREISKGLLVSPCTKYAAEKQNIETIIQRRVAKSQDVTRERLIYFKLRDVVASDENNLKSLENLGDDLTLIEYEQLKMQSQSCVEKLEERDSDLHRLRSKATSAIQALAEIREKTHTLLEEIEAGKVLLHDVNQQLIQTRERVGCEKKRRDMSRSDTVRLRQEAGLLSEPKLLQDYKESLYEKENLLQKLQDSRNKYDLQKKNILSLRRELSAIQQGRDRDE